MSDAVEKFVLRGREEPFRVLRDRIDKLVAGRGSVVVAHGGAGMGKTAFLAEAGAVAAARGVRVRHGACHVLARSMSLGPILTALSDGPAPVLGSDALFAVSRSPRRSFWLTRAVQGALEQAARSAPLMIAVDDLQWADPDTLAMLTALAERLTSERVLWLVAVRDEAASPLVAAALDRLVAGGSTRIEIGPLDLPAVAEIVRDVLGADPGPDLPAALTGVESQPLLLTELLRGFREENGIGVVDGTALLVGNSVPRRVQNLVAGQLRRLSGGARQALQLGAALGDKFTAVELAAMVDRPPAAMLVTIREVITAGLLVSLSDGLAFRHRMVGQAVRSSVPATLFSALRRKAITVRLDNGAPPADVVGLVMDAVRPGDITGTGPLERAATEVGRFAPAVAGELAGSGAEALTWLRIATLALATDPVEAIGLSQRCQRLPGLAPTVRAQSTALIATAYHILGDRVAADGATDHAVALAAASSDAMARVSSLIPEALQAMARHEWDRSLELIGEAVKTHRDIGGGLSRPLVRPDIWQVMLLLAASRFDEALDLADAGLEAAQRRGLSAAVLIWSLYRAGMLLESGRIIEARAEAERLLAMSTELGGGSGFLTDTAQYIVGRAGLHQGGPDDLDRTRAAAARLRAAKLRPSRWLGAWLTARLTALDGAADLPYEDSDATVLTVTAPRAHHDAVELIRMLMAAGAHERAEAVSARLDKLATAHPTFPFLRASAVHGRALVKSDPELAAEAVALHQDNPRALVRASAHEDAGRLLPAARRDEAVANLTEAHDLYAASEADLDIARVRARLRERGVRRLATRRQPPPHAWPELTESEVRVARLAGTGSKNREIADRLHLSPHTVNSHLRHIFDKLGVRSRVELARIVTERIRQDGR